MFRLGPTHLQPTVPPHRQQDPDPMNRMDRFHAAVEGRSVDRIPFIMWLHFVTSSLDGAESARLHARFFREFDLDAAKVISDYRWPLPAGMETFESPRDMAKIRVADMADDSFQQQFRLHRVLRADLGADWPLMDTSFDPVQQITRKTGLDTTQMIYDNPRESKPMLEAITESLILYIRELKKIGVDSVLYSIHGAICPPHGIGIDEATFNEFHKPYDIAVLEEMKGMVRVLHACQWHLDFNRIKDYPFEVLSWADRHETNPSLAAAREFFPGKCLMGGFDHTKVIGRSLPALRAEVKDAIAQTGGRQMILAPGCTIASQVPCHLIDCIRRTADEAGPVTV